MSLKSHFTCCVGGPAIKVSSLAQLTNGIVAAALRSSANVDDPGQLRLFKAQPNGAASVCVHTLPASGEPDEAGAGQQTSYAGPAMRQIVASHDGGSVWGTATRARTPSPVTLCESVCSVDVETGQTMFCQDLMDYTLCAICRHPTSPQVCELGVAYDHWSQQSESVLCPV